MDTVFDVSVNKELRWGDEVRAEMTDQQVERH